MKLTLSLARCAVLLAIGMVAFVGIFSCPLDDSPTWFSDFIISKAVGFGAGWAMYRLGKKWQNDPLIQRYMKLCEED